MQPKKQWTIAGGIGTLAVIAGLWTSLDPWPKVGWETPNSHDRDIAIVEGKISEEIENTQIGLQIFRDEWTCTRWFTELNELYEKANSGDISRRLRDRIDNQRRKMDARKCERFGSY